MTGHIKTAGWPRGLVEVTRNARLERNNLPNRLPMPWINGNDHGDFHSFRDDALEAAYDRCCVVCGLRINGSVYFASSHGEKATSGMGGHARCILLAVTRCPHIIESGKRGEPVAWRYDGPGLGVELPKSMDTPDAWGDADVIDASCVEVTVDELREAAKAARDTTTYALGGDNE